MDLYQFEQAKTIILPLFNDETMLTSFREQVS